MRTRRRTRREWQNLPRTRTLWGAGRRSSRDRQARDGDQNPAQRSCIRRPSPARALHSHLCLPSLKSLPPRSPLGKGILKFISFIFARKRKVSFWGRSRVGTVEEPGREADEARSSVPQRQLRSERVAMRGDGGASAASGGRSDGRSTAGKRDRRRSRCVVGRALAKGAAPRERAAVSVLSRGIAAIGVG